MPFGTRIYNSNGEIQEDVLKELNQLSYTPIKNQIYTVKDPKTNKQVRRFHGAFEGGFSAGYYNTVGSKEGFTPISFRSTKNEKSNFEQDIRDIMDEEDMREILGERKLVKTESFDHSIRNQDQVFRKAQVDMQRGHINLFGDFIEEENHSDSKFSSKSSNNINTNSSLIALIDSEVSIGEKLLRRMGWRGKEAIGKVDSIKKTKTYSASLPPSQSDYEPVDITEERMEIIIKDTPLPEIPKKNNLHGIGYVPESRNMLLSNEETELNRLEVKNVDKKIKQIIVNTKEYDTEIGSELPITYLKKDKNLFKNQNFKDKDFLDAPGPLTYNPDLLQKENKLDLRNEIYRGFLLGTVFNENSISYPIPVVPKDFDPLIQLKPVSQASISGSLSIQQRSILLSEVPLPNKVESILPTLAPDERDSVVRSMTTSKNTIVNLINPEKTIHDPVKIPQDTQFSNNSTINTNFNHKYNMETSFHHQIQSNSDQLNSENHKERIPIDIFKAIFEEDESKEDYIETISQNNFSMNTLSQTINPFRKQSTQPAQEQNTYSFNRGFEILNSTSFQIDPNSITQLPQIQTEQSFVTPQNQDQKEIYNTHFTPLTIKKRSNKIQSRKRTES